MGALEGRTVPGKGKVSTACREPNPDSTEYFLPNRFQFIVHQSFCKSLLQAVLYNGGRDGKWTAVTFHQLHAHLNLIARNIFPNSGCRFWCYRLRCLKILRNGGSVFSVSLNDNDTGIKAEIHRKSKKRQRWGATLLTFFSVSYIHCRWIICIEPFPSNVTENIPRNKMTDGTDFTPLREAETRC
jgi:hypothetical protein